MIENGLSKSQVIQSVRSSRQKMVGRGWMVLEVREQTTEAVG